MNRPSLKEFATTIAVLKWLTKALEIKERNGSNFRDVIHYCYVLVQHVLPDYLVPVGEREE